MNWKNNYKMFVLTASLFLISLLFASCASLEQKNEENAKVISMQTEAGNWTSTMSNEETEKIRYLLKEHSGWNDVETCACVAGGDPSDNMYEIELDGVYYNVCNWYWLTPSREIHSISYKDSKDEEYKHAMLNENKDVMTEIYELVRNRSDLGTEYSIFMDEHQKNLHRLF